MTRRGSRGAAVRRTLAVARATLRDLGSADLGLCCRAETLHVLEKRRVAMSLLGDRCALLHDVSWSA